MDFPPFTFDQGTFYPILWQNRLKKREWAQLIENMQQIADCAALQWYVDHGVFDALCDAPQDRTKVFAPVVEVMPRGTIATQRDDLSILPQAGFLGKTDAYEEAVRLAKAADSLEALRKAVEGFDGIALKRTATNMVFADGHPKARVMLVGEAPGADEDRIGRPFVGVSGQLLDKILKHIGLDRTAEDVKHAIYISNVLNWRPPGNRTPSPAEVEVSLPFIERHIELVNPDILILCGGVAAKALLGSNSGITQLRKGWHDYKPLTAGIGVGSESRPVKAIYHPSYLLRTPSQKAGVWQDMLEIAQKIT